MVPDPSTPAFPSSSSSSSTTTPVVSGNAYQDALDGLQPLQPVLRGFNHRNRNQHRRAAWWAPFGMLRRHVEKLVDELIEAAAAAAAAAAASTKSKSKKRRRDGDGDDGRGVGVGGLGGLERNVKCHVGWLRDVLVPKCYLAFSQLTADNQFATLSVVLLGVLAQVNATCVRLVGEAPAAEPSAGETGTSSPHGPPSSITTTITATRANQAGSSQGAQGQQQQQQQQSSRPLVGRDETPGDRGGTKISRDEVARAEKLRRKKNTFQPGSSSDIADDIAGIDDDDDEKPLRKQKQQQQEQATSSKTKINEKEVGAKPAKKKKTKKGGDEFDDLFKNLF
ncbi:uncharacterized protein F4812DRAFT_465281 [Daldinia caldariorum]|uniref:uncharacterized protein n=1 Tax=Daldinia caldariorum TaxID=326644 RepID=UPI0020073D50|nr:uncharacterized protein F4812DRAFT_465281 [Daldinia caldariorum]KAI1467213.1 hypothetical protein F4812DRAFT_465281 [Daldinia caldariorum]